jgi:glucose-6-phosphate isomerase/transaldolase/glucose-6-phosphate isomerase
MKYFKGLVESAVGSSNAGRNFVVVTDPGTPLARQAEDDGFRCVFLNPPDIGGRYSVLSYFGLVPAALIGVDISTLLDRTDRMKQGCASSIKARDNPGAWLGATMGTLASQGRDKLTLLTTPEIDGFGLWAEQLIAESTGKEGKGIVPIAGEPYVEPSKYGDDRLFVYLRLRGNDNSDIDKAVAEIKSGGQPVLTLEMRDKYDLGAEFFRWEFATAVAGAVLGINPFDQPDVQSAKDATQRVLEEFRASGNLPQTGKSWSFTDLLAGADSGRYLAIMAYLGRNQGFEEIIRRLRREVTEHHSIPTTFGYGPRFLHSTGQLHKGGPDTGLFLQIVMEHDKDLSIPDEPYTFGVVADAQALGDLEALQLLGRRVARIKFNESEPSSLAGLEEEIE